MASGREVSRTPLEPHYWTGSSTACGCASQAELPAGYTHGWHYSAPLATMPVYLGYLSARFERAGGSSRCRR